MEISSAELPHSSISYMNQGTIPPKDLATAVAQLEEHLESLPEEIRDLLEDPGFAIDVYQIAEEHQLSEEYHFPLLLITETLLLGDIRPQDYVNTLSKRLDLSRDKAANIARDINMRIFHDIKDALLKVHGLMQPKSTTLSPVIPPITTANIAPVTPSVSTTPTPYTDVAVPQGSSLDQKLSSAFTVPHE